MEPQIEDQLPETKELSPLHQVTPLSKYLAMILFIAMPFIGGWIGYSYSPEKIIKLEKVIVQKVEVPSSSFVSLTPSVQDIQPKKTVIDEASINVDTFTGYYNTEIRSAWGEDELCHQLIVQPPNNELTEYFIDMVKRGNTVQGVNDSGRLKLNLPWSEISEADKQQISQAINEPVTLILKKNVQQPKDAIACHSFFTYVGLK